MLDPVRGRNDLWLVQKIAEGKNLGRVELESKSDETLCCFWRLQERFFFSVRRARTRSWYDVFRLYNTPLRLDLKHSPARPLSPLLSTVHWTECVNHVIVGNKANTNTAELYCNLAAQLHTTKQRETLTKQHY